MTIRLKMSLLVGLSGLFVLCLFQSFFFSNHHDHHYSTTTTLTIGGNTYCGVSPFPDEITLEQPEGNTFQAYLFTIGRAAYLETTDGYTIIQDANDLVYRYASRGVDGDLYQTGMPVSAIAERTPLALELLKRLGKHLRYEGQRLAEIESNYQLRTNDDDDPGVSGVFPPTGTRKSLLLLIDYPDQPFTFPNGDFDNLANQVGYSVGGNNGSFRDYFMDISYGLLIVNTDVEGWYTADSVRAHYGIESLSDRNFNNAVPLIREAVDAAETAGVDFSQYDGDNDGRVDVVEVIHSGRGAEESGNVADIWSHRWVLSAGGLSVTYDGKIVNDYIIQAETQGGANNITNIGVIVHEFGHALGLPDLYDIDGSSSGISRWCCMAGGTWNEGGRTPAQFSAWCKEELGWMIPTVLTGSGSVTNMDYSDNASVCYRINTDVASQYFLLENRQKVGWDEFISGEGLAIYHIDNSQNNNANENQRLVDLEQADGLSELNGSGASDNGDLFPGSTNNTTFDCGSLPNSNLYGGGISNVAITNITEDGTNMSFDYDFCSTDCLVSNIQPSGNVTNFQNGTYDRDFVVAYGFAPGSGTLDLTVAGITVSVAITTSPQTVSMTGLPADGQAVNASASFSAEPTCTATINNMYTAPFDYGNNDACDAADITANIDGDPVLGSNLGTTVQTDEPRPNGGACETQNRWCSNNTLDNTVWFKFTAPASGSIDVDFNTAIDMQMALWEATSCQGLLVSEQRLMIAANDDSGSAGGFSPRLNNVTCLVPGRTYYLQIDGWNGTEGEFSFNITDPGLTCPVAPTSTGNCGTVYSATSAGHGEWLHIEDGAGERIASVNDRFNDLGTISVEYNINTGAIRSDADDFPLLDRDITINVVNDNPAMVRLYLTQAEFAALQASGGPANLSDLTLLKVNGGECANPNTGTSEILTPNSTQLLFDGTNHMLEFAVGGFSSFFPRSNAAILPIDLAYFRGEATEYANRLQWASNTEENTEKHLVERLIPGDDEKWEVIGEVPAAGSSQSLLTYEYQDRFPKPVGLYRIQTVDFDGSTNLSDIIQIERKLGDVELGNSFPNPTNGLTVLPVFVGQEQTITWQLIDAAGIVLATNTAALSKGATQLLVDLTALPAGVYYVKVVANEQALLQKIVRW